MPRNGSGTYAPPVNSWNPAVNTTPATAADFQALLNDMAASITQSISKDGQTPITSPITFDDVTVVDFTYSGTLTGGTAAINIGSGQIVKDTAGNVGLGVTPSAWGGSVRAFDLSGGSVIATVNTTEIGSNYYFDGTNSRYKANDFATKYAINNGTGSHQWFTAPSGTAGGVIAFTQAMTLLQNGNLLVGTATDNGHRVNVLGDVGFRTDNDTTGTCSLRLAVSTSLPNGVALVRGVKTAVGDGYLNFSTSSGGVTTEAARFTSTGFSKHSNTGTYGGVAGIADQSATSSHIFQSNQENSTLTAINGNVGAGVLNIASALATGAAGVHFSALLNATTVCRIIANGNLQNANNSYGAISDVKYKENIVDAPSYLQKFMHVRFRKYNMIGSDLVQFGVVAQELEEVFPGLVEENPDFEQVEVTGEDGQVITQNRPTGTVSKSVKYSILAQIQGKVIQEQQVQIEKMMARLTALESAIAWK